MRALKWKSSETFHPRKIVFLTSVKGKRIDVLRSFLATAPIHQEVNTVANKAGRDAPVKALKEIISSSKFHPNIR